MLEWLLVALHLHHGPDLELLGDTLAEVLAVPVGDPFAAEVVAAPTAGMRDWLRQRLSQRLGAGDRRDGIVANVQMVFPGRFNAAAFGAPLDVVDPWDVDRLTWVVLDVLERGVAIPGSIAAGGRYRAARRIADLFDRYANNRPQLIQHWAAGHDSDGVVDDRDAITLLPAEQRWQPAVWRAARDTIGVPSRAERMPELLAALADRRLEPALPDRVAMFGASAMSAAQWAILRALGEARDVHAFVVHPSDAAWRRCRQRLDGRLTLRSASDAAANVTHLLLRTWARPAMEMAALTAADATRGDGGDEHQPTAPTTLLQHLRADLVADRAPHHHPDATLDRSLQVHAATGATRQLEVMRDAIGHALRVDPTLAPHDIVIVCPDLARFAPLAASVFGRGSLPIPISISDLSLGRDNPVAAALDAVLATVSGRVSAPELLALCALDPIRRRLGIDDDDVQRFDSWIGSLGVTWGLDAEHRREWVAAEVSDGAWSTALQRLFAGAAISAAEPRIVVGDVVPFDDVDAGGLRSAGRLADLIDQLTRLRRASAGVRTMRAWVEVLTAAVAGLCATDPNDGWQLTRVLDALADAGDQAVVGDRPAETLLDLAEARAVLTGLLGDQRGRLRVRSGAVTLTSMAPVRSVPARIIGVLGLDEAGLRASGADGDDVLMIRPCVGEREPRFEARQQLLEVILAARQQLIITYDGRDITTNRRLPRPVQLDELLEVAHLTLGMADDERADAGSPVVIEHPRHGFAAINLTAEAVDGDSGSAPTAFAPGQPFSFDPAMLVAGLAQRSGATRRRGLTVRLEAADPDTVTIAQLAESCAMPARTFVVDRLDARLPRDVEEYATNIPLEVSPLATYAIGSELLDLHRRGADDDRLQGWSAAQRRLGVLPPRELATTSLAKLDREVEIVLDAHPALRAMIATVDGIDVDLVIAPLVDDQLGGDGAGGDVRLRSRVGQLAEDTLVRVDFKRPKERIRLHAALELAALTLHDPSRSWQAVVVARPRSAGDAKPTRHDLRPRAGDERVDAARALLRVAVDLRRRALREPLPLFERASWAMFDTGDVSDDDIETDLRDSAAAFLWAEMTSDDLLALPSLDHDPAIVREHPHGRLAGYADYLWSAYRAFIDEGSS